MTIIFWGGGTNPKYTSLGYAPGGGQGELVWVAGLNTKTVGLHAYIGVKTNLWSESRSPWHRKPRHYNRVISCINKLAFRRHFSGTETFEDCFRFLHVMR